MTIKFARNFFFLLLFTAWAVSVPANAQEGAVENEGNDSQQPANIIEVDVEAFQSEALRKFLKEYRLILQQAKTDVSDVLKKHRKEYKRFKREHLQSLKATRQNKLPKVVLKRIPPPIEPEPEAAPPPDSDLLPLPYVRKTSLAPEKKDRLLSLNARHRIASIGRKRDQQILQFKMSEMGQLKSAIASDPLKGHQAKLTQFSDEINKLLEQIAVRRGNRRTAFLKLANAYLESQRYLDSLESADRFKLTSYAPRSGVSLGSYDLALWAFKMALTRSPNDGETNFLMGKLYSEIGNRNLALERAKNAERLFTKNRQAQQAAETRSFIDSLEGSSPKS